MPKTIDVHVHLSSRKDDALIPFAKMNGLAYTLDELLQLMDENGVGKGLMLSPPLTSGLPVPNEEVIALTKKSRGRLKPILTVTPDKAGIQRTIAMAKKNSQIVKGFKVLLGYFKVFADSKVFLKLYEYAEEEGLPVMFHTGDTADHRGSLVHSHPLTLDALANARPELKIVACHFGNPWIGEVGELIYKHENVFADVSGLAVGNGRYSERYINWLLDRLNGAVYYAGGAEKILFGSDYPVTPYLMALKLVKKMDVDHRDRERILWGNAKQVYGL